MAKPNSAPGSLTYKSSGVDIDANDVMVEKIRHSMQRTYDPRVVSRHGGFAGLMRLDFPEKLLRRGYKDPVLAAGADGVGSKLLLGIEWNRIADLGIDLVAMNVNDVLTCGAEPLFFLDYIACHKLKPQEVGTLVAGISRGCQLAGCALLGGETAEMPALYAPTHFDLAGFCVGAVENKRIIDGRLVEPGDIVIGLASSGLHSNGFSLVRAALDRLSKQKTPMPVDLGEPLEDAVLRPTRIYVKPILSLLKSYRRKRIIVALAHVTGGGLEGNVPRVVPANCQVVLRRGSWPVPAVFRLIQSQGVDEEEMYRVFNMGIGFVLVVKPPFVQGVMRKLAAAGESPHLIGCIRRGKNGLVWK
ncbi:MAG TPA: phosphoribosylformylglycinamidine cyclo-ligase [Phycisphaerae bacterium]|nr:phosphoribosylformylglycinamidine cyclo-ligase [Phycisphaerae bacterium]